MIARSRPPATRRETAKPETSVSVLMRSLGNRIIDVTVNTRGATSFDTSSSNTARKQVPSGKQISYHWKLLH